MMLASGVAPVVQMQRIGVDVGIGTDGPAGSNNNLDMVEEMASAARLQKVMRGDPKALTGREVLEFGTIGGARVLNLADRIGSLEAGKRADIAIIDLQPRAIASCSCRLTDWERTNCRNKRGSSRSNEWLGRACRSRG